jgi:EmrB/QacA subfamily drug resistance transporter
MTTNTFDPALRRLSIVVALGAIMTVLDTTIVNVAVQVLGRDLHTTIGTIQWVLTGYTLALSMTIPITGWAVRRFGTRSLWLVSLGLFIAGSILCGIAWSPLSLIAFRVLQGVGGGLLMPVGQMMLARAAGPERLGRAMAVVSVPAMLAPALGPVFGGWLIDALSWRWMFFVNVPVCAAALLLAVRLLPRDDTDRAADDLDVLGLVLLSPGLAALVFGLSRPHPVNGWLGLGIVLLIAFVAHAIHRHERALVDVRLFGNRGLGAAAGSLLFYCVAMFGVLILLPLYDQSVRGGDTLDAGVLVAPLGAGAIVTMLVAGRLTDHLGARVPAVAGILTVLAGTAMLSTVDAHTGRAALLAMVFVVGLGHGLVTPSVMAGAYVRLPRTAIPAATTGATIVVRVGSALGAAVFAILLQHLAADDGSLLHASGDALVPAYRTAFWCAFAIAAAAVVPTLLLPAPVKQPEPVSS